MSMYQIKIGEYIKRYRENNSLSQKDFGELFGVSSQAVYKWEHNLCYPDITLLPYIAEILECKNDDFFEAMPDD